MKEVKPYTLTKAEMQVMNILWDMPQGGCVHDIIARYEEPKPAYTTIATFMKILLNKKFVSYRKGGGKTQIYYPLVSREEYTRRMMKDVKNNFFGGSGSSLLKFFVSEEQLTEDEINELIEMINRN
ncbi:MAG: BlaI/MecI/CopY family transcriptional regulator [Mediterranea massiliensis]|nr:BlaI/MecI/CopY family transcriptional regulator [Mediterranea massiliensis]